MSSATKDFSTGNTDLGDPLIVSYAFTGVAEKGSLVQSFLKIISFQTTDSSVFHLTALTGE